MSSIFGALVQPVPIEPVRELGPVHFIAVGGAGMAPIAELYAGRGVSVSGSDRSDSPNLARLREHGVTTYVGHRADQLGAAETVVVSSAITEDNPEVIAAREAGLRIWHRSTALAALMLPTSAATTRTGIAVGGTHGKTTTSGMLAHILIRTGADPGFVVGSPLANEQLAAADGSGPFVVEADESDGSFRQYDADISIITNIEADHLDNWETAEAYAAGFVEFAEGSGRVVVNIDDPGARQVAFTIDAPVIPVGRDGTWYLSDVTFEGFTSSATLHGPEGAWPLQLAVPGQHNLDDAAAAVVAAVLAGVDPGRATAALADFRGTNRRFTPHGPAAGVQVFDDYAHHPTEISAALRAARAGAGTGRVLACFQPHLFSRTRDFVDEFGAALAGADEVFLCEIFGAREDPIPGVDSSLLERSCRAAGGTARLVSRADLARVVADAAEPGDVILTLGAGDITHIAPQIVAELHGQE